jgi:hypothetical protein
MTKQIVAAMFLVALAGCSLYRNDRAYIWDSEYQKIRDVYDQCGSVAVVEEIMREHEWTQAQINEVRYRLAQDYSLDEKGIPRGIDRERPITGTLPTGRVAFGSTRTATKPLGTP